MKTKEVMKMKSEIFTIGNGRICVKGYKHKIVVMTSNNGGNHWNVIETIKGYGSHKKCSDIFNSMLTK